MLMCSLSVVFTVLVLNYHHRTPDTSDMPRWVSSLRDSGSKHLHKGFGAIFKSGVCLQVKRGICEWLAWMMRMTRPGKELTRKKLMQTAKLRELEMRERSSKSLLANVLDLDDDIRANSNNIHYARVPMEDTMQSNYPGRNELRSILKELQFLTDKMKKDEEFEDICNDWKFAAMVIDRLCLWLFTVFTIVSTFAILFSAPHILA